MFGYDEFRAKSWGERVALFAAMSPAEKAGLFKEQISGWLDRHREDLTDAQIDLLTEAISLCTPEAYTDPRDPMLAARLKELERRAMQILSPSQFIDSLTIQWGVSCSPRPRASDAV